jgi:phosphohistidine phosphatase
MCLRRQNQDHLFMKTLLLLRHAKAGVKDGSIPDFDRPLAPRGQRDAPEMGRLLRQINLLPEVILSSAALRARQTAEAAMRGGELSGELRIDDSLYSAEASGYRKALTALAGDPAVVLLVGHNPVMEDLVYQHGGQYSPMPTAALAVLELPIAAWSELRSSTRAVACHIYKPKD